MFRLSFPARGNGSPIQRKPNTIAIGHSGIAQETGASFKFQPIDKLTTSHERAH